MKWWQTVLKTDSGAFIHKIASPWLLEKITENLSELKLCWLFLEAR